MKDHSWKSLYVQCRRCSYESPKFSAPKYRDAVEKVREQVRRDGGEADGFGWWYCPKCGASLLMGFEAKGEEK